MERPSWAREVAERWLAPFPLRWAHVVGVAGRAEGLAGAVDTAEEHSLLVCAAYLHDLGYAPQLAVTGFHPLDGALHLATEHPTLAGLVASHTGARHEARLRGLLDEVEAFTREMPLVEDALAYCDLTVGPDGAPMTPADRLADVERRYGREHVVSKALRSARPDLEAAVARVEARLAASDSRVPKLAGYPR